MQNEDNEKTSNISDNSRGVGFLGEEDEKRVAKAAARIAGERAYAQKTWSVQVKPDPEFVKQLHDMLRLLKEHRERMDRVEGKVDALAGQVSSPPKEEVVMAAQARGDTELYAALHRLGEDVYCNALDWRWNVGGDNGVEIVFHADNVNNITCESNRHEARVAELEAMIDRLTARCEELYDKLHLQRKDASEENETFGAALNILKNYNGHYLVARKGWNGKGMWLRLVQPHEWAVSSLEHDVLPFIGMKTAQGEFVPWVPSQTDLLADDWMIVEGGDQ